MSALLWIIVGYVVLDRLITIGKVGDSITIDRPTAVASTITGAVIVTVLVLAATRGVTP